MRVRGEVLKNENKEKLLYLIFLVSAIFYADRVLPAENCRQIG